MSKTCAEEAGVLGQYIPLHYHYNMLTDRVRMEAFKKAILAGVPKGGKVLDLGGGTGVLSYFASMNASRVWCVERDPEVVSAARSCLSQNPGGDKVEVVQGDAMEFLPPEPVDVVICEMLHVAMLREKQIQVIDSFKKRYTEKFGPKLPLFIPEASLLGVQPIQQDFDFLGFHAAVTLFQDPVVVADRTRQLGEPLNYQIIQYERELTTDLACEGVLSIREKGILNALRFTTKNVLLILVKEKETIEWFSQYMILPVKTPMEVQAGDQVRVRFSSEAGASIESLRLSIEIQKV